MKRKMIELRFLVRGGEKILQYRYQRYCKRPDGSWGMGFLEKDWQDVPTAAGQEGE